MQDSIYFYPYILQKHCRMSKELPYFKFEPAAYLSGDITICSHEAQGVYINLCCLYWQNDCKLGLSKALRRFKQGLIDELIEESVVKVVEDQLVINFLDEQRSAPVSYTHLTLPTILLV